MTARIVIISVNLHRRCAASRERGTGEASVVDLVDVHAEKVGS